MIEIENFHDIDMSILKTTVYPHKIFVIYCNLKNIN